MFKLTMKTPGKEGRFFISVIFKGSYLLLPLNSAGWPTARPSVFYWVCPMALGETVNICFYIIAPRLLSIPALHRVALTEKTKVSG